MSRAGAVGRAITGFPRVAVRGAQVGAVWLVRLPGAAVGAVAAQPRRAGLVLGLVAVVLAAATVTFSVLSVRQNGIEQARTAAVAAAEQKVPQLLSYDYRTLDKEQQAKIDLLTGGFHDDYAGLLKEVVLPAATKSQLTTSTTVVTDAVVTADSADTVTMLMFLNQTSSSAQKQDPVLAGSRLRVTMNYVGGDWKVSELTPV